MGRPIPGLEGDAGLFCRNCGAPLAAEAVFCGTCATPVDRPVGPAPTPAPVPPSGGPYVPVAAATPTRSRTLSRPLLAVIVVVILVAGIAGAFLAFGGGGSSSVIQGVWIRSGSCGVTWSLEFRGFGGLSSTETEFDSSCGVVQTATEGGSWSSEDLGDLVYAYFWDTYRATVYRSSPNEMTVHRLNDAGSADYTWGFVRA